MQVDGVLDHAASAACPPRIWRPSPDAGCGPDGEPARLDDDDQFHGPVETTGIAGAQRTAIAGITIDHINALNSTQGNAFTTTQIQAMSVDQINALITVVNA